MSRDVVSLTNCDRESIHIPGSIQPHGCLIALDAEFRGIQRHSLNTADFLRGGDLIGLKFEDVFGDRGAHDLRNALSGSPEGSRPALVMSLPSADGRLFDVSVHRWKGHAIVELEPVPDGRQGSPLELARTLINRLKPLQSVEAIAKQTPRLIRALLGYDRVMVYQFMADGAGKVIAEAKRSDLESFLGQYFPASDIPRQARELYLKNTIRIISDANCARIPIEPEFDASGEPLDLSFAHLRSVSPIHCEYLRNMGVGASMSISIVVGGELWGLIACHHYSPRVLSMANRVAAEMFGDFFSLHLEALIQKDRLDIKLATRRALDTMLREIVYHDDVVTYLRDRVPLFSELIACDGVGMWINGTWTCHGLAPPASEIAGLARYFASVCDGKVWATHELSAHVAAAEAFSRDVAGVLVVPISQIPRDFIMFFRKEVVETLEWAGNPDKTYQTGPHGDRLTPRKSFAIWRETVERKCRPWSQGDRENGEAVRMALLEVVMRQTEVLSEERRKADIRQKMLNEELNHRVKNILALIKSLVSQPVQAGRSLEDYVSTLKGRIMALSFAHDQVIRSDGGGSLRELLEAELMPYRAGSAGFTLDGPDVVLDARAYSVMALVFHELATNAAKYGAFSATSGHVDVAWTVTPDNACDVRWTERDGPAVSQPKRDGFGTVLVDRSVPFDLGGESELNFEPGGVSARFLIPGRFVRRTVKQTRTTTAAERPAASDDGIAGLNIMILEDQLVIAIDAEAMLAEHGAVTRTAATAAEALSLLAEGKPDVAVLDVHLGMETSFPVAVELKRLGVPFVFATGFGDGVVMPDGLKGVPIVRKPYSSRSLVDGVARVAGRSQGADAAPASGRASA
jgi:light-regulated signal transduction histidine kinase (bacteriophytochrome)/CheY-like chemotaxis protein